MFVSCLPPAGGVGDGGEDVRGELQGAGHSLLPPQPPTARDDRSWRNRE